MLNMRKHLTRKARKIPNVSAIPVYQRSSSTHYERSVPPYASIQIGVHTTPEWDGKNAVRLLRPRVARYHSLNKHEFMQGYNQDHVEGYAGLEAEKFEASTLYVLAAPRPALTS